ncbi:hypothetical protein SAMN04489760_10495 [Syntrophus gentianae]|uniref:Mannosylglycerate hydrolase MGH1-like glycoside hydrolase domain-containing protein n=2 Tax=Syntrophus gentianae TaxID=43775 RepID=A0A1H7VQ40_9BACT|nr:hypothetical protein SAMN04489760_10495 [Syntrophus gentianae]
MAGSGKNMSALKKHDVVKESEEILRLIAADEADVPWRKWGPYLSERQWGTVREDYSENGDAWSYFTHDHARSRAYHWGEDGLAGISDEKQRLCFALAFWNERDPILKERLFGLTNSEGNHGEDVKEYYFYIDSTPTHSYMKYLYKYPQAAYPYDDLVKINRERTRKEYEYELIDTGIFDDDRYFDIFVEYAKGTPEDILIRISAWNRGPDAAVLHILPTLWFRNTWSWSPEEKKPEMAQMLDGSGLSVICVKHEKLGERFLYGDREVPLLFTENETNNERLFGTSNASPYVKDGIHSFIVHGDRNAVNPDRIGTKAAFHHALTIAGGDRVCIRLRLTDASPAEITKRYKNPEGVLGEAFDELFSARIQEADEFYDAISPDLLSRDERDVMRQALAGLLWTKQYYYFDLDKWLSEHQSHPLSGSAVHVSTRNRHWYHMVNDDIISMPDKWEYPWYAAWDLAFHTVGLSMVDPVFSRRQLELMLSEVYLHPNGQIPAYEWNFGDVNPPVHAWATLFAYSIQQQLLGRGNVEYLKQAFTKLLMNFTWWVNRKDSSGNNVFEGGFLGLDNIGVFDRSSHLPTGGYLEQADGTAWMALFSQNMLELALEIATEDPAYEDVANKFLEHFFWIAAAIDKVGANYEDDLWDEEDGFFYDLLRMPDGTAKRIKVRSMVGLLPLCAATVIPHEFVERFPRFLERATQFLERHSDLLADIHPPQQRGVADRHLLSVLSERKLRRILTRMLDEERFLSPYGIRSLSRWHKDHPYLFTVHGEQFEVKYLPAESDTGMFGGNSNWRGPVWFPVNLTILRALLQYYLFYGDSFKIECPTGSGNEMNLFEVAKEISRRLSSIFLRDSKGCRPAYGGTAKFNSDPYWRDYILFYEYFHGDNGAGLGASHQTGWTATVAKLIQLFGYLDPDDLLKRGARPVTQVYLKGFNHA